MIPVLRTIPEARRWVQATRSTGKTLGLVPTLGYLHEGHLSLIRRSRQRCERTLVSVFLNPTQFAPGEDFERYPRDWERDLALLTAENADAVFHPEAAEMYPQTGLVSVCVGALGERLCGASRPGHFQAVATVVAKLFHILQPDRAFFGQKDAQQALIIRQMVRDLNFPVEIEVCPTVREPDGLARSSRNAYLSAEERAHATVLYRALSLAETLARNGTRDVAVLEQRMRELIQATPGAALDYARVVDPETLADLREVRGRALAAVAVRFGKTRLIDNQWLVVSG